MAAVYYEGIATMYMTMPMSSSTLPVMGKCTVENTRISLKFPITGVSFDLPEAPRDGGREVEFKMSGGKGEMTLNIAYKADLQAFVGHGKQDGVTVLSFIFFRPDSCLKYLRDL